jgi:beta-lactam-binding protein with PASTA domain
VSDEKDQHPPEKDKLQEFRESKRREVLGEDEEASRGRGFLARLRAVVIATVIASAAFFTGLGIFNYVLMPRWVHHGEEVRVPDISNLKVRQAEALLDKSDLRLSIRGEQFDTDVPKGFILWQDPPPHDVVRRGRTVAALVSLGEEFASVPALHGESRRGAGILLTRAGLDLGEVVEAYSSEVGHGLILATDPGAQAVVARGSKVNLVVSLGASDSDYLMPDLRGHEVKSVKQDLEALGFPVDVFGPAGSFSSVVDQSPSPGSRIQTGHQIVLRVAGRVIP